MRNMVDLSSRLEGIASKLSLFTNSKLIGIHYTPCGEIPCARSGSVSILSLEIELYCPWPPLGLGSNASAPKETKGESSSACANYKLSAPQKIDPERREEGQGSLRRR